MVKRVTSRKDYDEILGSIPSGGRFFCLFDFYNEDYKSRYVIAMNELGIYGEEDALFFDLEKFWRKSSR